MSTVRLQGQDDFKARCWSGSASMVEVSFAGLRTDQGDTMLPEERYCLRRKKMTCWGTVAEPRLPGFCRAAFLGALGYLTSVEKETLLTLDRESKGLQVSSSHGFEGV